MPSELIAQQQTWVKNLAWETGENTGAKVNDLQVLLQQAYPDKQVAIAWVLDLEVLIDGEVAFQHRGGVTKDMRIANLKKLAELRVEEK